MKCLKISHRVILYSLFALLALPFLFSSGRVSASSASQTYTSSDNLANLTIYDPSNNTLGFTPTYYKVEVIPLANLTCSLLQQSISAFLNNDYNNYAYSPNTDCSYTVISSFPNSLLKFGRYLAYRSDLWDSIVITFYDTDPAASTPCPECPEVPTEIEALEDIKKAVLFIPAMLFVIYLFYILYSFYIGGSR